MDLAKIRKKSLLSLREFGDERFDSHPSDSVQKTKVPEAVPVAPVFSEENFFQPLPSALTMTTPVSEQVSLPVVPPMSLTITETPYEAILAARSAAGCDSESVLAVDATSETVSNTLLEYLCFRVSDEVYGIDIMDIKEIIKPREVTEVPRAPVFVSGILSLRGTIIPIIDMRRRLGLDSHEPTGKERIIVIKNSPSFSGLLVDEVIQVVQIQQETVEAAPPVLEGIDRDFISGIGRSDGRLIIILNLRNIADIDLY